MSCTCLCNVCPIMNHCTVYKHSPMYKKQHPAEKHIVAYTAAKQIPLALSNYMPACNKGVTAATAEFKRLVNESRTPAMLCNALNAHRWTTDKFTMHGTIPGGFIIRVLDVFGNTSFIKITN